MSRSRSMKSKPSQPQGRAMSRATASAIATRRRPAAAALAQTAGSPPASLPTVSVCTVTQNRSHLLPLLETCILNQTYPRHLIEWVVVDDSDPGRPPFTPSKGTGLKTRLEHIDEKLILGKKRNLSHRYCEGEIIVYMDDDEFYPPSRIAHAVESLQASGREVAGATNLPILFIPERELWMAGPYGDNHATANTFAFRRSLLEKTRYEDEATHAEEKAFLKNYSFPMVQLDPKKTIICFGHQRNTFEKRRLIADGKNPRMRRIAADRLAEWIDADLLERYVQVHGFPARNGAAMAGTPAQPAQPSSRETLFLICSPPGSGEQLIFDLLAKLGAQAIVGQGEGDGPLSSQLLKPNALEPKLPAQDIRKNLQHLNQQLAAYRRKVGDRPFILRDSRAAVLLHDLAGAVDVRLITCLRPLVEIASAHAQAESADAASQSSRAHRIYGQIFSMITNSQIPFQLVRHQDLVGDPGRLIDQLILFCGLRPSEAELRAARQLVAAPPVPVVSAASSSRP